MTQLASLYTRSSCCSRFLFCWEIVYLRRAIRKGILDQSDMVEQFPSQRTENRLSQLQQQWERELRHNPHSPSISRALWRVYQKYFLLIAFCGFLGESLSGVGFYLIALIIENLIGGVSDRERYSLAQGMWLCGLFTLSLASSVIIRHNYQLMNASLFVQIRESLSSLIYRKALRLSLRSLQRVSEGKIINAASSDLVVLDFGHFDIIHLMFEPFVTMVYLFLMGLLVGYVVLLGFAVIVVLILVQLCLGGCVQYYRHKASEKTDLRLKLIYDTASGIRTIKAYGWELQLALVRNQETGFLLRLFCAKSFTFNFLRFAGYISTAVIFFVKSAQEEELKAGPAFAIFACFNFMSIIVGVFTGHGVLTLFEFKSTLQRTTSILLLEEKTDLSKADLSVLNPGNMVEIKGTKIAWGVQAEVPSQKKKRKIAPEDKKVETVLEIQNLEIKRGELLAVIGPVGAGKTTFLASILKETEVLQGELRVQDCRTAYVEQEPFIISETVEANIMMGLEYQREKFEKVSRQACLEEDYRILAKGSKTQIGERGINISGGQKARVSLARALYSDADLYLLDDPLSAVDAKISAQLMEDTIRRYLSGKTRILVTHQLQVLAQVDRILYLQNGGVSFLGTYEELLKGSLDLRTFMGENEEMEKEEEEGGSQEEKEWKENQSEAEKREEKDNLIQKEEKEARGIKCRKMCEYSALSCGCCTLPIMLVMAAVAGVVDILISEYIRMWVEKDVTEQSQTKYRVGMLLIVLGFLLLNKVRIYTTTALTLVQTKNLHHRMVQSLVRGTVLFFDTNPVGRIASRFSKDLSVGDFIVPMIVNWFFQCSFKIVGVIIVVCIAIPWMLIPSVIIFALLLLARQKILAVAKQAMKLDQLSRSPISTVLAECLTGLVTIRAYRRLQHFLTTYQGHADQNGRAFLTFHIVVRAFGYYLDLLSLVLVAGCVFAAFLVRSQDNVMLLALSMQLVIDLLGSFQFAVRISSDLESYMTSINRCLDYTHIGQEAALFTNNQKQLRQAETERGLLLNGNPWRGKVVFERVTMRYRGDLEPALKDFSLVVQAGSKVGIVGRTGAGKSSILQTLFRMRELEPGNGAILIDGMDISSLGLHELRRHISVIPQSPFLFRGTVRENLDPFDESKEDSRYWRALEAVELDKLVRGMQDGLDTSFSQASALFSAGQKQLVCLARAILNDNRILILDEATANVDVVTEKIILKTLKQKFQNCTVITIAHRLDTIMDSDKVVVMAEGRAVESGSPLSLLLKKYEDSSITAETLFAAMVKKQRFDENSLLARLKGT